MDGNYLATGIAIGVAIGIAMDSLGAGNRHRRRAGSGIWRRQGEEGRRRVEAGGEVWATIRCPEEVEADRRAASASRPPSSPP